jgi:hypothetical protein
MIKLIELCFLPLRSSLLVLVQTHLWEANWLNGTSPMLLVPNLYKQARFKFRTVKKSSTIGTG